MFIGRKEELSKLEKLYRTDRFQMPVIYGRRRIGKTALINEFIKDKPAISFTAIESSLNQNLENFSRSILKFESQSDSDYLPSFRTFQEALEYVFSLSLKKRFILVIDEYPYLARADKSFSSVLQAATDKYKDKSGLFLILCGSSMSFMEEQVLGYESPLYGRRTAQFKISPFSFFEIKDYMNSFSPYDTALLYGISGGTPQYFLQYDKDISVEENIKEKLLDTSSYLFEEPENLLKQEVREAALYNAVITAVAEGSTKISEIASKISEETSTCTNCLKKLMSLGIIKKETPFGEKQGRKSLYVVEDSLFRFWYRFIPENISALQNGMEDVIYRKISEQFNSYMGYVFEEICKQYLWLRNRQGSLPFVFTGLGRWWGTDSRTRTQEEIDIIAADGSNALICECKWRNEPVGTDVLDKLSERSTLVNYTSTWLFIFSKSGFTESCRNAAAERPNVFLVSFEQMYEEF